MPASARWSFGQIVVPEFRPKQVRSMRLNWNTEAYLYSEQAGIGEGMENY